MVKYLKGIDKQMEKKNYVEMTSEKSEDVRPEEIRELKLIKMEGNEVEVFPLPKRRLKKKTYKKL